MKKRYFWLSILCILCMLFASCGSTPEEPPEEPEVVAPVEPTPEPIPEPENQNPSAKILPGGGKTAGWVSAPVGWEVAERKADLGV